MKAEIPENELGRRVQDSKGRQQDLLAQDHRGNPVGAHSDNVGTVEAYLLELFDRDALQPRHVAASMRQIEVDPLSVFLRFRHR